MKTEEKERFERMEGWLVSLTQNSHPFNCLSAICGTTRVLDLATKVQFDVHKTLRRISRVTLEYNSECDMFNLVFQRSLRYMLVEVQRVDNLYADQLKDVFERITGLALTIPRIKGKNC